MNKYLERHLRKLRRKEVNMEQSKSGDFNLIDFKRVLRNALILIAPFGIAVLTLVQQGQTDPKVYLACLNFYVTTVGIDFFRKWKAGK